MMDNVLHRLIVTFRVSWMESPSRASLPLMAHYFQDNNKSILVFSSAVKQEIPLLLAQTGRRMALYSGERLMWCTLSSHSSCHPM